MTVSRDIVIRAGQAFALSLPYAGTAGPGRRLGGSGMLYEADVLAPAAWSFRAEIRPHREVW